MGRVHVDDHAFKHGLGEADIRFAWGAFHSLAASRLPQRGQVLAIGCDQSGRLVQMVAVEGSGGVLIYHAMSPPTNKALSELGLMGRKR